MRGLPQSLIESVEDFERQIACGGDLSEYVNTQPFSPKDGVGNRTLIEHYHLRPCKPSCFLVGLVRSINAVYILDVFEHPAKGTFASSEIEERLYSRLADLSPELAEYQLPPIYRSGMPVSTEDRYNPRVGGWQACRLPGEGQLIQTICRLVKSLTSQRNRQKYPL